MLFQSSRELLTSAEEETESSTKMASGEITAYGDSLGFSQLSSQKLSSQHSMRSKFEELPLPPPTRQPPVRHQQLAFQSAEILDQQQQRQKLPHPQQLIQPHRFKQLSNIRPQQHKRLETTQPPPAEVNAGFLGSEERRTRPQKFPLGAYCVYRINNK